MNLLLLDNHDSFTWNLAGLLEKHDKINVNIHSAETLNIHNVSRFDKIIFSPGPGLPEEHPLMFEILEKYGRTKSILGICLGHQAIALHFGARLVNLQQVVHGQARQLRILNPDHILFKNIIPAGRVGLYHSWAVEGQTLPDCLEATAISEEGTLMALRHKSLDISGLQFHPESIITEHGQRMIDNWLKEAGELVSWQLTNSPTF